MRKPLTHTVKSWPESFNRIIRRQGDFDIRYAGDRDYQRGDTLRLCEWESKTKKFTGRVGVAQILDIMRDHEGLEEQYVVLGIFFLKMENRPEAETEDWP